MGETMGDRFEQFLLSGEEQAIQRPPRPMQSPAPAPVAKDTSPSEPLLVSPETRAKVRKTIEDLPAIPQFIAVAAPATIGAFLGFLTPVPGGAAAGGLGGELLSQDIGISPRSKVAAVMSVLGPMAGKAGQLLLRGTGQVVGSNVIAKAARARGILREAVDELEALGTKVIAAQQGLMRGSTSGLFKAAEKSGVSIPAFRTTATRASFAPIRKELSKKSVAGTPEGRFALRLLNETEDIMSGSAITFGDIVVARQMLGPAIRAAERSGGLRAGASKLLFKGLADDLDHLASLGGKTGNVARVTKAAFARAKLGFAVDDLQTIVAKHVKDVAGLPFRRIDAKGLRQALSNATNPSHPSFNKSMTDALIDELPVIKARLVALSEHAVQSPSGPGGLILRGRMAGFGAAAGSVFGSVGALVGAVAGATAPEMIIPILANTKAFKVLEFAAKAGKGNITNAAFVLAGEIAAQALKEKAQGVVDSMRQHGLAPGVKLQPSPGTTVVPDP